MTNLICRWLMAFKQGIKGVLVGNVVETKATDQAMHVGCAGVRREQFFLLAALQDIFQQGQCTLV
ncbi:hypothetical protein D3C72_2386120 [compost metagenome]